MIYFCKECQKNLEGDKFYREVEYICQEWLNKKVKASIKKSFWVSEVSVFRNKKYKV